MFYGVNTVNDWLTSYGLINQIINLQDTTATATDAASALHCSVSQIAKSLVFYNPQTNIPFLIVASGSNRVDKEKVGEYLSQKIKTASPEFVLKVTGYPVGAVPPIAHLQNIRTLFDQDLLQYDLIYASAGSTHSIFSINPRKLAELTSSEIIKVVNS